MKKWAWNKILYLCSAVTVAGLVSVMPGYSQDWASLKESFRNIQSVKAEFLQERHLQILKDPLISDKDSRYPFLRDTPSERLPVYERNCGP